MPFSSTLAAARTGSEPALGALLESCHGYVAAVAARQVPQALQGRVRPSSLVQETYLRACRNFDQFHGQSERQLLAWLRQILLYCLANVLRRPEFRRPLAPLPVELAGREPPPDEQVTATERSRAVGQAIARLPAHYQVAIELRHFDGFSFEEVGRVLGCSAEAARKVWVRAQAKLGEELQRSP
ncbi:MAG TPA: sigma-70 family RNA polymerase sigma factor [Gemmataceae bacterium]|jgi:RNA polymerase sigma-70 factor (ECF subfamily)|nr:sigma-70 family RNA polymerase sigma factor [Gemmataceae bacterium]